MYPVARPRRRGVKILHPALLQLAIVCDTSHESQDDAYGTQAIKRVSRRDERGYLLPNHHVSGQQTLPQVNTHTGRTGPGGLGIVRSKLFHHQDLSKCAQSRRLPWHSICFFHLPKLLPPLPNHVRHRGVSIWPSKPVRPRLARTSRARQSVVRPAKPPIKPSRARPRNRPQPSPRSTSWNRPPHAPTPSRRTPKALTRPTSRASWTISPPIRASSTTRCACI